MREVQDAGRVAGAGEKSRRTARASRGASF